MGKGQNIQRCLLLPPVHPQAKRNRLYPVPGRQLVCGSEPGADLSQYVLSEHRYLTTGGQRVNI